MSCVLFPSLCPSFPPSLAHTHRHRCHCYLEGGNKAGVCTEKSKMPHTLNRLLIKLLWSRELWRSAYVYLAYMGTFLLSSSCSSFPFLRCIENAVAPFCKFPTWVQLPSWVTSFPVSSCMAWAGTPQAVHLVLFESVKYSGKGNLFNHRIKHVQLNFLFLCLAFAYTVW